VWPFLAAYDVDDVEAAAAFLAGVRYRRARHVVTEMARITAGVAALRCGDIAALGRAIDASHRSTAEDYDVSCAELDAITDAARECAGVFGARLTGAGFGGCAIALVAPGAAEQVISHVGTEYRTRFGIEPGFRLLHAGAGPRIIRGAGG
jgi:galactokinase